MKFFAALLLLLTLLQVVCYPAIAAAASQNANVTLNNVTPFDEWKYDWPGNEDEVKPPVDKIIVSYGYAESPIMPFGECVYIDNNADPFGSDPFVLSFKTKNEWEKFKKEHAASVTLHPGCPHKIVESPCKGNSRVIDAGREGAFATVAFSSSYISVYQCEAITPFLGAWKLIGENTMGGCPKTPYTQVAGKSCRPYSKEISGDNFPDGTGIILPGQSCARNLVCMNGEWEQTSWWRDGDTTRQTGPSRCQ